MKVALVKRALAASGTLALLLASGSVGGAAALASNPTPIATSTGDQARITAIINAGNKEIDRRLSTLGTLTSKINSATKLTASDKADLSGEVSSETSGLMALKSKLDAETTFAGAKADAQSIFNDYRVYALVVPKVELVKVADDQQVVEGKLTALAAKLQTRITTAKNSGKDVSGLQTSLNDMTAKVQAAWGISSSIENKVVGLQPSDYNSDHTLLSGDRDQLKTARQDNQAAFADAKNIVAGLKNL